MRYWIWVLIGLLAVMVLAVGCKTSRETKAVSQGTTAAPAQPQQTAAVTVKADEAACPVLGTVMKKSEMIPIVVKGTTYYLCCQGCVKPFKADPQKYIDHPATPKYGM